MAGNLKIVGGRLGCSASKTQQSGMLAMLGLVPRMLLAKYCLILFPFTQSQTQSGVEHLEAVPPRVFDQRQSLPLHTSFIQ